MFFPSHIHVDKSQMTAGLENILNQLLYTKMMEKKTILGLHLIKMDLEKTETNNATSTLSL